jgi:hypothetical protein
MTLSPALSHPGRGSGLKTSLALCVLCELCVMVLFLDFFSVWSFYALFSPTPCSTWRSARPSLIARVPREV